MERLMADLKGSLARTSSDASFTLASMICVGGLSGCATPRLISLTSCLAATSSGSAGWFSCVSNPLTTVRGFSVVIARTVHSGFFFHTPRKFFHFFWNVFDTHSCYVLVVSHPFLKLRGMAPFRPRVLFSHRHRATVRLRHSHAVSLLR